MQIVSNAVKWAKNLLNIFIPKNQYLINGVHHLEKLVNPFLIWAFLASFD